MRHRRVAGLRREELAPLAGVSVGYYTRLEQGQSPNVSDEVLDVPAITLGRRGDILAWNRLAQALLAPHWPFDGERPPVHLPGAGTGLCVRSHARAFYTGSYRSS